VPGWRLHAAGPDAILADYALLGLQRRLTPVGLRAPRDA
jgi:hypothetical protein